MAKINEKYQNTNKTNPTKTKMRLLLNVGVLEGYYFVVYILVWEFNLARNCKNTTFHKAENVKSTAIYINNIYRRCQRVD